MNDSIDTNILLRCILGDVPKQRTLASNFLKTTGLTHYLSDQALSECIYVLETAEKMSREEVAGHLTFFLLKYNNIAYNRELTSIAIPLYLAHPKLSWNDCALAAEAEARHHEPLFTFDKKLVQQLPQAKLLD